jgi:hypothetical protein
MDIQAKVLRAFRDKQIKKTYKRGDTFSGTKERFDEINARGKDKPFLALDTLKSTDNAKTDPKFFGGLRESRGDI